MKKQKSRALHGDVIRLLLVDDDPVDAALACTALSGANGSRFHVEKATRLKEAIELLKSSSFDVMLLDLGLPESHGLETLARIRRETHRVPVIVLTGLADAETALHALDEGAQDYLVKDEVTSQSLTRSIRYAIQRHLLLGELRTANGLLERKNLRLGQLYKTAHQFVDNVSHEFRTPLTVIREFSSIMRDGLSGPLTAKQIEHLDAVIKRTDDLCLMVDDMLDISKLEAGLLSVWRRPCQMEDMLAHVRSIVERRAEVDQIALEISVDADLPEVFCDEEKVRRIIINLVVNAIKFTPRGGRVTLSAARASNDQQVVVQVSDTGPGISPENLEIIFERFKQLDGDVRSSTKGFGLGLNIAKELVRLNLGTMDVESHVGEGSTFSFTLPFAYPTAVLQCHLDHVAVMPDCPESISMLVATMEPSGGQRATPVVDEFLQHSLRATDLVLQAGPNRWLLITLCPRRELNHLVARITKNWAEFNRNYPHGDLPAVSLQLLGSWHTSDQRDDLIASFHHGLNDGDPALRTIRKVLVVDDDRDVVVGLTERLEAAGYDVITANDGAQGLAMALEQEPDAIVLDVRMPIMDGMATLEELRKHAETLQTPIVMLSASVRDQQRALDQGVSFFISKPYDAQTVISALEASMNGPVSV